MGIQDRDYYRNEGPSVLDTLLPSGIVCRWLIAFNVGVWFLQIAGMMAAHQVGGSRDGWVTDWLILDTNKVLHGEIWRLLTSAFAHSTNDYWHIIFNMVFLWWFGSDVEQLYGRKEFLAFYLSAALAGSLAYFGSELMLKERVPMLGASGAVTGLLVLCALHYPTRIIYVFMLLPVPIWIFALIIVGRDAFLFFTHQQTGVAVACHLGGAAFAFAYWKYQHRITDILGGLMFWKNLRPRSRLKIYQPEIEREEPVAVSASSMSLGMDEHLEAKVDAILEKMHTKGKDSLTSQEHEILKQASEMYKRKRT